MVKLLLFWLKLQAYKRSNIWLFGLVVEKDQKQSFIQFFSKLRRLNGATEFKQVQIAPHNKVLKYAPATSVASAGHLAAGRELCVITFSHNPRPFAKCRLTQRYVPFERVAKLRTFQ